MKKLGYRWTLRIITLVFVTGCFLTPFSSTITGPITSTQSSISAGASGSGSGWGELSVESGLNSTNYCGQGVASLGATVNEDSIKRLPLLVWIVVASVLVLVVIPR